MKKLRRLVFAILGFCLFALPGWADQVGDPAAPLSVKAWIRGQPVQIKPGTNIYVVEFWAALSSASKDSIPKLNELQKKFKDKGVVVLGIGDDPVDKLRQFVELYTHTNIEYTVAADDLRKTAQGYMVAYGQNGIPHAFIVGQDAKVLWHGHPLYGLEEALDQITAGKYDLGVAIKAEAQRAELDKYKLLSRQGDPAAKDLGRQLLLARTNDAAKLCEFSYRIVSDVHNTNRDFALAAQGLEQAAKLVPTNNAQLIMTRVVFLYEQGKKEEGIAMAKQAFDAARDEKEKESLGVYLRFMETRLEIEKKSKTKSRQMPSGTTQKKAPPG